MKRQNGRTEKLVLIRKLRRYFSAQAEISRLYEVIDNLEPELVEGLKPHEGRPFRLGKRAKVAALLKDNFKKSDGTLRNKVFRAHGLSHFSIDRVSWPWP